MRFFKIIFGKKLGPSLYCVPAKSETLKNMQTHDMKQHMRSWFSDEGLSEIQMCRLA